MCLGSITFLEKNRRRREEEEEEEEEEEKEEEEEEDQNLDVISFIKMVCKSINVLWPYNTSN